MQDSAITDQETNLENIEAFYYLKPEYIEGTRNVIMKNFNDFDPYLNSLGVDSTLKRSIQKILLK